MWIHSWQTTRPYAATCLIAAALALGIPGASLLAAGLQIAPVSLTIPADKKADEIWLRNSSNEVVHAQVRVYRWSQSQGEDVLAPDGGMMASPPMVQIEPGKQQLVRLVRMGPMAAPSADERTYRLLIDELPIKKDKGKGKGLDFVFRYSVPVFIAGTAPAKPVLAWSMQQSGKHAGLVVTNSGNSHAQLADISFTPPGGKTTTVAGGLAGYVLSGQYRNIPLTVSPGLFTKGGTFTSLINGVKADTNVAPITKAH